MGFHHLSSADYSVPAATKDKAMTECNMKAVSLEIFVVQIAVQAVNSHGSQKTHRSPEHTGN